MGYNSLAACVDDLEKNGRLRRIDYPVDPYLEMAAIQRRAFLKQSPALLFTNPKNCKFRMLANLYGTRERVNFIFRNTIANIKKIFQIKANPKSVIKHPLQSLRLLPAVAAMRPKFIRTKKPISQVCKNNCALSDLPRLVSWPGDGGAFITLPAVYSEDPITGQANLGMYRIQMSGNKYETDEIGLHYQIHRGIGVHHAKALEYKKTLPVSIYIGGPPALALSAIMPLPEGMNEFLFASLLMGKRLKLEKSDIFDLPIVADSDFCIQGYIQQELKPEGPFGDHVGYYSLRHDFPVIKVKNVLHRDNAIWPFTSVGRPPQEDTVFGDLIHELTSPLISSTFPGVQQIHAVDAAGVHPLLIAIGSERYTPYEEQRKPRELLTLAMHLLGTTQTSLAKYLLIMAKEDVPNLNVKDVESFFLNLLERTDFHHDLHFITNSSCDTLDYSGTGLHQGSKLIWAACGDKKRQLATEISGNLDLGADFCNPRMILPGVMVVQGPPNLQQRTEVDDVLENNLCPKLGLWSQADRMPLIVVADDSDFCAASFENFLWVTFTRSDPAKDVYGYNAKIKAKSWICDAPLVIDARQKPFHAPMLEEDADVVKRIEQLATRNGPLYGLI